MPDIVAQRSELRGPPGPNMRRTAALWSAYLGHRVSAHDVAVCLLLVKCSRAKAGIDPDNYVDMAGYAAIAGELAGE